MTDDLTRAKRIIGRLWQRRRAERAWARLGGECVRDTIDQLRRDFWTLKHAADAGKRSEAMSERKRDAAEKEAERLRADLAAAERMNRAADEDRIRLHAALAEARARIDKARSALDYDLRPLKDKPEKYDAIWRANQRAYLALVGAVGKEADRG